MMKMKMMAALASLGLVVGLAGCGTTAAQSTAVSPAVSKAGASVISGSTQAASSSASSSMQAAGVSAAGVSAAASQTANTAGVAGITEEQAKTIALAHAGLAESDVVFVSVHLDWDDGRQVYEVEFYSGNTEYDYDIDASSGEIVGYDTDIENYTIGSSQQTGVTIAESEAKAVAMAKVPGATDEHIRIYLDYDDGIPVYEGSIVYGEMKYEFEISAADGTVREWDVESVYDD